MPVFAQTLHSVPRLAVVLVGDRPDSRKYVQHKTKACKDVGIDSLLEIVPLAAGACAVTWRVR